MANNTTLARPYANAVFELALAKQQLPLWRDCLHILAQIVSERRLALLLTDPRIVSTQLLTLISETATAVQASVSALQPLTDNFLRLLLDNRRLTLLPTIAVVFDALVADHQREVRVNITSALALDPTQQEVLRQALSQRLQRKVHLSLVIEPQLIGGAIIRAGDIVIDGSIRGRLQRLTQELM